MEYVSVSSTPELLKAFIKAQAKFKTPELNRTAEIKNNGKVLYETYYADLEEIISCVKPALDENGLGFFQTTDRIDKEWFLVLELVHISGEIKKSFMPINMNQLPQQLGGTLTYLKRYQASAFFGLAADFDDDGNTTTNTDNEVKFGPKHRQALPKTPKEEPPKEEIPAPVGASKPKPTLADLVGNPTGKPMDRRAPLDILVETLKKYEIPNDTVPGIIRKAIGVSKSRHDLTDNEINQVLKTLNVFNGWGSSSVETGRGPVMTDKSAPTFPDEEIQYEF